MEWAQYISIIMKKECLMFGAFVLFAISFASCGVSSKEVIIGKQIWMTENLNVSTFRNGDPITHIKTNVEWEKAGVSEQPAWCYFDNDPTNWEKYGKLYNWYALNDPRGLAPEGWHIPSDAEWTQLADYLGEEDNAAVKMKSKNGWKDHGNGTNESRFTGLPGGYRSENGTFSNFSSGGYWWSSTEDDKGNAWYRYIGYQDGALHRGYYYKEGIGFSVRCLRD